MLIINKEFSRNVRIVMSDTFCIMKIENILKQSQASLPDSETSHLDVEVLLSHILQKPREYLRAHSEAELTQLQSKAFEKLLAKRKTGAPIAYLVGHQEFWSLDFLVNESVLIPRPETELLVETVLARFPADKNIQLLDLGTGSGAIAIAIAHEKSAWEILATDQSADSLNLAKENASRLNVNNVQFILSDWFSKVPEKKFDAIISNPPYVAEGDVHLLKGDVRFEPQDALVSGQDGLSDIRLIVSQARNYLTQYGMLAIEHGFDQASDVRDVFKASHYHEIKSVKDLSGVERVCIGRLDNT